MNSHEAKIVAFLLLFAVWLLVTGYCDLDWQLVSYRFSEWHRNADFWEYCPFLRVNWWLAYQLNVGRVVLGSFILGAVMEMILREVRN